MTRSDIARFYVQQISDKERTYISLITYGGLLYRECTYLKKNIATKVRFIWYYISCISGHDSMVHDAVLAGVLASYFGILITCGPTTNATADRNQFAPVTITWDRKWPVWRPGARAWCYRLRDKVPAARALGKGRVRGTRARSLEDTGIFQDDIAYCIVVFFFVLDIFIVTIPAIADGRTLVKTSKW